MILFPPRFISVPRHPGYLWEPDEQILYSFKSGVLKALAYSVPSYWNDYNPGFYISTKGRQHYLRTKYLQTLKNPITQFEFIKVEHVKHE